jgi:hypothetical protein
MAIEPTREAAKAAFAKSWRRAQQRQKHPVRERLDHLRLTSSFFPPPHRPKRFPVCDFDDWRSC